MSAGDRRGIARRPFAVQRLRLRFGDCVFDGGTREILRGRQAIHLPAKTFRLLELLLENRPKAIPKEKLIESLWPDVFVADGNLARLVAELRDAIGDDAHEPKFVRTVHGFGYAFAGDASPTPDFPQARASDVVFKLVWNDREIALGEGVNILGRDRDAVVWIDVHSVSRHHARIVVSGDSATIEDLGSKNGTFLKGKPATAPRALADGDRVRIGTVEMTLRRYGAGVSTETAHSR
jgi:DNA-binding winged helix-turn-helix (wHTH) protein